MLQGKGELGRCWIFLLLLFSLACDASVGAEIAGVLHLNAYESSSANTANNTIPLATGTGYAFAESCQAALRSWSHASIKYGVSHNSTSTSYFTSDITYHSRLPGTTVIHSVITLCDGHPRVVGRTTATEGPVETIKETWTNTNPTVVFASYPTPAPCSISPEDCKLLYSSWTRHWSEFTKTDSTNGLLNPPCTTSTTSYTYSTNSKGGSCDNCQVIGSKIRLLYWPVITKDGSDNLCEGGKAVTVTTAPTGSGPNTFVTDGVTITSPSVAVSIGGLSRVDECGTVIPHTIIPVLPEDVSSVEGARALFTHRPFNFANLNYRCLSDPNTIFMTTGARTDCYQEVPASDYFQGLANAAGANWWDPDAFVGSTIWPNYAPQVLPPETLTEAIRSLWGKDCNIHPDGVWDPPIALSKETDIPAPEANCTSITYLEPTSTPAMPAAPTMKHSPPTSTQGATKSSVIVPTIIASSAQPIGNSPKGGKTFTIGQGVDAGDYTLVRLPGGFALVDGETTMMVDPQATQPAPMGSVAPTTYQPINLGSGKYTVSELGGGKVRIAGQSTTIELDRGSAGDSTRTMASPAGDTTGDATTFPGAKGSSGNGNASTNAGADGLSVRWTSSLLLVIAAFIMVL